MRLFRYSRDGQPVITSTSRSQSSRSVLSSLLADPRRLREHGMASRCYRASDHSARGAVVPIRLREQKMKGFRSPGSAQRFLSTHAAVANTFTTCRHLISAATHRQFRAEAFGMWRDAADLAA